ncbi:MAG TPA: hypothetical protein VF135_12295 [Terriglobales bacterium]
MNFESWLLWGFIATILMTTISAGAQGLGLTRMNLPYVLGTIFTPDRDRAKLYGFLLHLGSGWVFSIVYVAMFEGMGAVSWWRGAVIGFVHGLFVLIVVMSLMPGLHPRMASEQHGPSAGNMLEPPGFLALNYGARTPLVVMISHLAFGIVLGAFYHLK